MYGYGLPLSRSVDLVIIEPERRESNQTERFYHVEQRTPPVVHQFNSRLSPPLLSPPLLSPPLIDNSIRGARVKFAGETSQKEEDREPVGDGLTF